MENHQKITEAIKIMGEQLSSSKENDRKLQLELIEALVEAIDPVSTYVERREHYIEDESGTPTWFEGIIVNLCPSGSICDEGFGEFLFVKPRGRKGPWKSYAIVKRMQDKLTPHGVTDNIVRFQGSRNWYSFAMAVIGGYSKRDEELRISTISQLTDLLIRACDKYKCCSERFSEATEKVSQIVEKIRSTVRSGGEKARKDV